MPHIVRTNVIKDKSSFIYLRLKERGSEKFKYTLLYTKDVTFKTIPEL